MEGPVQFIDGVIRSSTSPGWLNLWEKITRKPLYKRFRSLKGPKAFTSDEQYELGEYEECDQAIYNVDKERRVSGGDYVCTQLDITFVFELVVVPSFLFALVLFFAPPDNLTLRSNFSSHLTFIFLFSLSFVRIETVFGSVNVKVIVQPYNIARYVSFLFQGRIKYILMALVGVMNEFTVWIQPLMRNVFFFLQSENRVGPFGGVS